MRRVACSILYVDLETVIHQAVVEINGYKVVDYYPIEDELAETEWLGGIIFLSSESALSLIDAVSFTELTNLLFANSSFPLYAYHLFPVDGYITSDSINPKSVRRIIEF